MASNLGTCKQCAGDLCVRGQSVCCMSCGLPLEGKEYADIKAKLLASTQSDPKVLRSPGFPKVPDNPPLDVATVKREVLAEVGGMVKTAVAEALHEHEGKRRR